MFAAGKTNALSGQLYVDDVFSTWLYDGNGSTQTITNGIDLSTYGGLVWFKSRSTGDNSALFDSVRGDYYLRTSSNVGQSVSGDVYDFNSNGFTLKSAGSPWNGASAAYASWTFRKAPKFFDVVTYTGTGANRTIAHNLGSVPGMIIVKRTDTTGDWEVYHRSLANTEYMVLNTTAAKATDATMWNSTTPTASVFSLGTNTNVNASGGTYVAYLFAHDTATDGFIQCGGASLDVNQSAEVNLGWEPQFVMVKLSSTSSDWRIVDALRGMPVTQSESARLFANLSSVESRGLAAAYPGPLSTISNAQGFQINFGGTGSQTAIYVAIRRPNKPPTTGTQVFMPTVYTGTNVNNRLVNTTIAPDMVFVRQRTDSVLAGMVVGDRLRGQPYLLTGNTAAEATSPTALDQQLVSATEYGIAFSAMNGFWVGTDAVTKLNVNTTASNHIAEAFKRAPGVFDVVCYAGTSVARTVAHNLGVAPELMIVKKRAQADWWVYNAFNGNTKYQVLNSTAAPVTSSTAWNNTTPTASVFTVGTSGVVNEGNNDYVAYLFATSPGISKVFSYTGNGSSQTINCGFTTGARFVLIKRTDSTGNWYVWDSARGIVAGDDPHLSLNTTAAEVTTDDSVDTDSTGFVVNQLAATNVNVTSATYIGLAFA